MHYLSAALLTSFHTDSAPQTDCAAYSKTASLSTTSATTSSTAQQTTSAGATTTGPSSSASPSSSATTPSQTASSSSGAQSGTNTGSSTSPSSTSTGAVSAKSASALHITPTKIGLFIGIVVIVIALICLFFWLRHRRKRIALQKTDSDSGRLTRQDTQRDGTYDEEHDVDWTEPPVTFGEIYSNPAQKVPARRVSGRSDHSFAGTARTLESARQVESPWHDQDGPVTRSQETLQPHKNQAYAQSEYSEVPEVLEDDRATQYEPYHTRSPGVQPIPPPPVPKHRAEEETSVYDEDYDPDDGATEWSASRYSKSRYSQATTRYGAQSVYYDKNGNTTTAAPSEYSVGLPQDIGSKGHPLR